MAVARHRDRAPGARAHPTTADALAIWATELEPSPNDLALAQRSLRDTVAVAYAARNHPLRPLFEHLGEAGRVAALAHVLDFDDLHMASTTHISAICVPVALASRGDAGGYLAGAGVMARLGTALGWKHYAAGWHATCTAGAPAAAAAASIAKGLDAERTAIAMALAVPAAGGVQRAFGTAAKALQVGFAADAGVRAAQLAAAGATADPAALDEWIALVGGDPTNMETSGEAVPGGLAIKLYPCCYALQRPISALLTLRRLDADGIVHVRVETPKSALTPLIHRNPTEGLQGKFSLEYGVAAALLDGRPNLDSFTDTAVQRPEARRLMASVEIDATDTGEGLLSGDVTIEILTDDPETLSATLALPPGAPQRPPTDEELHRKIEACAGPNTDALAALTYETAHAFLAERL